MAGSHEHIAHADTNIPVRCKQGLFRADVRHDHRCYLCLRHLIFTVLLLCWPSHACGQDSLTITFTQARSLYPNHTLTIVVTVNDKSGPSSLEVPSGAAIAFPVAFTFKMAPFQDDNLLTITMQVWEDNHLLASKTSTREYQQIWPHDTFVETVSRRVVKRVPQPHGAYVWVDEPLVEVTYVVNIAVHTGGLKFITVTISNVTGLYGKGGTHVRFYTVTTVNCSQRTQYIDATVGTATSLSPPLVFTEVISPERNTLLISIDVADTQSDMTGHFESRYRYSGLIAAVAHDYTGTVSHYRVVTPPHGGGHGVEEPLLEVGFRVDIGEQ